MPEREHEKDCDWWRTAYMEEECDAHKETTSDGRHLEKAALISQKPAVNYKAPTGSLRSPQAQRRFYNGTRRLVKNK